MTTHEIHTYLCDPEKPELRYFPHAVAETLSDLAAVLLYDIHGRLKRKKKPLIRDGHEWIYDTLQEFAIAHPYASESGVRRAFLALHEAGFIVIEKTGKFNRKKYDFKWWYRLTVKGKKAATIRLMRFAPEVAVALGIPKALLLESFRYNLHKIDNEGSVLMDPAEMPIPYSCKTIQRHLGEFVKQEILQKHPEDKNRYLLPDPDEGDNSNEPFTVPIDRLLPELTAGDVALLS